MVGSEVEEESRDKRMDKYVDLSIEMLKPVKSYDSRRFI
jgi:hypothetical protein